MKNAYDMAKHAMSGPKEHHKAKKEIKEVRTRKAKNGGYIHEHHHTHPEDHPMEEHMSADQDSMVGHMLDHMGEQNPGEGDGGDGTAPAAAPAPAAAAPVPQQAAAPPMA